MWNSSSRFRRGIGLIIAVFLVAHLGTSSVLANCTPGIDESGIIVGTNIMSITGCLGTDTKGGYVGIIFPSDPSKNTAGAITTFGSDGHFEIIIKDFPAADAQLSLFAYDEAYYNECSSTEDCNPTPITVKTYTETERFQPPPGKPVDESQLPGDSNVKSEEFLAAQGAGDEDNDKTLAKFALCAQIPEKDSEGNSNELFAACTSCPETAVFTALGCIEVDQQSFVMNLVTVLLSISGGIALLSVLAAAANLTISQGDTGKVKEAKDLLTAAVTGLLFIIFSVIILDFIGVGVLKIPGLG